MSLCHAKFSYIWKLQAVINFLVFYSTFQCQSFLEEHRHLQVDRINFYIIFCYNTIYRYECAEIWWLISWLYTAVTHLFLYLYVLTFLFYKSKSQILHIIHSWFYKHIIVSLLYLFIDDLQLDCKDVVLFWRVQQMIQTTSNALRQQVVNHEGKLVRA